MKNMLKVLAVVLVIFSAQIAMARKLTVKSTSHIAPFEIGYQVGGSLGTTSLGYLKTDTTRSWEGVSNNSFDLVFRRQESTTELPYKVEAGDKDIILELYLSGNFPYQAVAVKAAN